MDGVAVDADSPRVPAPGSFVVEAGMRQAWLFLTFCDNTGESLTETKLYLDTNWTLGAHAFDLDADELESGLVLLCGLINQTVADAKLLPDGGLLLTFDGPTIDHGQLEISGAGTAATTHDSWWLGRPTDLL
jgi:hypothetical protein